MTISINFKLLTELNSETEAERMILCTGSGIAQFYLCMAPWITKS